MGLPEASHRQKKKAESMWLGGTVFWGRRGDLLAGERKKTIDRPANLRRNKPPGNKAEGIYRHNKVYRGGDVIWVIVKVLFRRVTGNAQTGFNYKLYQRIYLIRFPFLQIKGRGSVGSEHR